MYSKIAMHRKITNTMCTRNQCSVVYSAVCQLYFREQTNKQKSNSQKMIPDLCLPEE